MFPDRESAINCARGDVVLVQDPTSGLIYNNHFDPNLLDYNSDYQNEQGVSGAFREHLASVLDVVGRHLTGCSLIEIGCGKGLFLELLSSRGYKVTGLDPAYEGNNSLIRKEYFSPTTGIKADGLILRHVLEHITDPVSFLMMLREANGGKGKIYIEVPCLDWISTHEAWFDIFYEHVNYFRLADFERIFGTVYELGHTFGGQYLSVVADLGSVRKPVSIAPEKFSFSASFTSSITKFANFLRGKSIESDGRQRVAIWGGASKGVTFALYMQRLGIPLEIVVDVNSAKQGRYLPASGIRVHSPAEAINKLVIGADVFVMNSNYLNEIREMTSDKFNYLLVERSDV
jgi:hypothetical protein